MYTMVPRIIYFNKGIATSTYPMSAYDEDVVMDLPTDDYNFLGPVDVIGKTKQQIQDDICNFLQKEVA